MFEFGDELIIIDSFNSIPWLISIQLFAMLLLFILLYHLTLTTSDHFSTATTTAPPPATALPDLNRSSLTSAAANTPHDESKARENEIKEATSSTSGLVQRAKKPDARRRADPSTTNEGSDMMFQHSHHPCHFFRFAKQAFLKCLGIDTTRERPREKDD